VSGIVGLSNDLELKALYEHVAINRARRSFESNERASGVESDLDWSSFIYIYSL